MPQAEKIADSREAKEVGLLAKTVSPPASPKLWTAESLITGEVFVQNAQGQWIPYATYNASVTRSALTTLLNSQIQTGGAAPQKPVDFEQSRATVRISSDLLIYANRRYGHRP